MADFYAIYDQLINTYSIIENNVAHWYDVAAANMNDDHAKEVFSEHMDAAKSLLNSLFSVAEMFDDKKLSESAIRNLESKEQSLNEAKLFVLGGNRRTK